MGRLLQVETGAVGTDGGMVVAWCVANVLDWVWMSLGTVQGSGSYTWLCFSLLENFFTN